MPTKKETDPKAGPKRLTTTRVTETNCSGNETIRERCRSWIRSATSARVDLLEIEVGSLRKRVRQLEARLGNIERTLRVHLIDCDEVAR